MPDQQDKIRTTFKEKVKEALERHPNEWTGTDSVAVVRAILVELTDRDGKPLRLKPEEDDVVEVTSRPTIEIQVRVLRAITEAHGSRFDKETERLIRRVVNPTAFRLELVKAGYITEKTAGGLKDLLG